MLIDLEAGASSSSPSGLTVLGKLVLFAAQTAATGRELYLSDGTANGSKLLHDIDRLLRTESSSPRDIVAWNGRVYFSATTKATGRELFSSDGSKTGSKVVLDHPQGQRELFASLADARR